MRYIDADKIDENCKKVKLHNYGDIEVELSYEQMLYLYIIAADLSETEDVVEVVRCKDCKWYDVYSEDICTHEYGMIEPNSDCFCNYGERHKI